jgi:hypothetical protein
MFTITECRIKAEQKLAKAESNLDVKDISQPPPKRGFFSLINWKMRTPQCSAFGQSRLLHKPSQLAASFIQAL